MIKIGKGSEVDYGAMTVDEIMQEISSLVTANDEAKETFLWQLYGTLRVGTCFRATKDLKVLEKMSHHLSALERAICGVDIRKLPGDVPHWIQLCPEIKKDECVLFLGMTEKKYLHEKIERRHNYVSGRFMPHNVVVSTERSYPQWIIGEKVVIWPLDLTNFQLLTIGSGERKMDQPDKDRNL